MRGTAKDDGELSMSAATSDGHMPLVAAMNGVQHGPVAGTMYRVLSIVLCVCRLAWTASGRAQEATVEPDPVAIEAMRRVLQAERLQLTDAWLLHEDREEREKLRKGRWWGFGFHALLGAGWGAVGVANLMEEGPPGWSIAAFGVSAVTLALTVAARTIEDHREGTRWNERLLFLQLGLMGGAVLAVQQGFENSRDLDLFYMGLGTQLLVQAAAFTIMHLAAPSLYVSEHYAGYRARTDSERAAYGLSMLLEREQRERVAAYTAFSVSVLNATIYTTVAFLVDKTEARPFLAITAGSLLINATVSFVMHLMRRTPSESIVMGLPPPAGEKL
jgi:hypothetical protein